MMAINEIVLAVNMAGTLAIGTICFFIVYTTFKSIQDEIIQEFSKRFLMAIAVLLLYVSYLGLTTPSSLIQMWRVILYI